MLRTVTDIVNAALKEWSDDKASQIAAAVAYYSVMSLAPLLIVALSIAGLVFGNEAAAGKIASQMQWLVGARSAEVIHNIIKSASKPATGVVSTVAATIVLLLGASGLFSALQNGLNTVWEVKPKAGRGLLGILRDRFLSLTMVIGAGLLVLVWLVFSAGLSAVGKYEAGVMPLPSIVLEILNFITSVGVFTVLFALMYKVLPDVEIAWSDVWIGGVITSLLFTVGKLGIGWYLSRSSVGTPYGAAGSLIVILIWIYYSAQIFFLGAEFTQVYANKYGSHISPDEDAVSVTEPQRAQRQTPSPKHHQELA